MACFEASDGDLGFHLATGREILRAGHIPSTNVLSFTEPTQPWLLHQWLPALVYEVLWQWDGLRALMALKLLLVTTTFGFVFGAGRALGASPLMAASACVFAAAAASFRFELRPYLFTHLTLAITVWAVARSASGASSLRAAVLWAAAAIVFGFQLHAGAIDSVVFLGSFAIGAALERSRAAMGIAAAAISGVVGAGLLLTSYHPWGARILSLPLELASQAYWGEHLVEYRRAWKLPAAALLAYWAWIACALPLIVAARRKQPLGLLIAALAFAAASLWYVRMAYAFTIVSAPLVAAAASAWWSCRAERLPRAALQTAAFVLLCAVAPLYVYRDHAPGVGFARWTWPLDHFAFIREHDVRGQAFVSDAWAGPFLGVFYPERKSFFDNRLEAYSDHFARDVYQHVRYGKVGWDAVLDRYGIELVLMRYTTPGESAFQRGAPNLRQKLARDARWSLVHFDDTGALFVRRQGVNAVIARDLEIPGVDPDRREFLVQPRLTAPGLLRAAERGQPSLTLIGLTALALADAGNVVHAQALARVLRQRAPGDAFTARVERRMTTTVAQP